MEEILQPSRWRQRRWIVLACLVLFIPFCYGVIDLWDNHAWNEYRQNYEAHVAPMKLQAYIPKPIPDDENFAATPFVQAWFTRRNDQKLLFEIDTYAKATKMMGNSASRKFTDLVAWQEAFAAVASGAGTPKGGFRTEQRDPASRAQAAPDVLDGLKDDNDALEELRTASARPGIRYPIAYNLTNPWNILLPHLGQIKQACLRLQLKACAELALGQNEKALADVKLMLYLADTSKPEPFFISYLVRVVCLHIAIVPIWEGLAEHRWTDAQLQQLQTRLESYNFPADIQLSLHAERGFHMILVDMLQKNGLGLATNFFDFKTSKSWALYKPPLSWLGRVAPSGWYDLEKLHYCQGDDRKYIGTMDAVTKRVSPRQVAANALEWKSRTNGLWNAFTHHRIIATLLLSSPNRLPKQTAAAQTDTDQAAVACALERYRLANNQFPDNLQSLVPRFAAQLPNDVITGEPFKYRLADDGRFVLYSVGWNEKDDGGVPGKPMFDENEGDWVW